MNMKVYAATHIGKVRPNNQDAYYAPRPGETFAAVADGLGGHQAGEIASQRAIEEFARWLRCAPRPDEEALRRAVIEANLGIYRDARAHSDWAGMGTTLTAVWFGDDFVYLAHVGDSRAYLFRSGALMQLSRDHSLVGEMLERGQITSQEAMVHPLRHYITRTLGTDAAVEPDIIRLGFRPDDVWLLCTDGMSNHVRSMEMAEALTQPGSWESRVDALVKLALLKGGSDNITVLLAVGGEAEQ